MFFKVSNGLIFVEHIPSLAIFIAKCFQRLSVDYATDTCQRIQHTSVTTLSLKNGVSHVGIYGNSDPSSLSQWVPIIIEYPESDAQVLNFDACMESFNSLAINFVTSLGN